MQGRRRLGNRVEAGQPIKKLFQLYRRVLMVAWAQVRVVEVERSDPNWNVYRK